MKQASPSATNDGFGLERVEALEGRKRTAAGPIRLRRKLVVRVSWGRRATRSHHARWCIALIAVATVQCTTRPSVRDPCAGGEAPAAPSGLTATTGPASIGLAWVNPAAGSFGGVRLLRRLDVLPDSPDDPAAVLVYEGTGTTAVDTALVIGGSYRYSLWSFDACTPRTYSAAPETAQGSPIQPGPPAPPSELTLSPGPHRLRLAWANPPGPTYSATIVRRDTLAFPASPTDGDAVFDGNASSCVDSLLSPLQAYYYAVFTRDVYGVVSQAAAEGSGVPDWEYRDFEITPLRIEERFPTQRCGPGDCDFEDRGPTITMAVSLKRFEGTFWVEVTGFRAEEVQLPEGDHSCIEKFPGETWASNTFQIPFGEGWIFHSYPTLPSTTLQLQYTDIDIAPDVFGVGQFIDYVTIVGSTRDHDICTRTEDDTHLHRLVTLAIPARFRR